MATTTTTKQTPGTWAIDASHSNVEFSVRHMMVTTVKGHFSLISGTMTVDANDHPASLVSATVDVTSVSTRDANRDAHLKAPDFFDAEKYPTITFRATRSERVDDDEYKVHGNLTIRDVTKPVVFEVEYEGEVKDVYGKQRASYTAKTEISRGDFGLTYNAALEAGGVAVSDKVKIMLDIALVHQG